MRQIRILRHATLGAALLLAGGAHADPLEAGNAELLGRIDAMRGEIDQQRRALDALR
ncbi:MAG: hypothetical protein H7Z39_00350, partial [Burkholderiaceae bacterium]|nr:hypothetical protein [Burkholderiaceae bacterium]